MKYCFSTSYLAIAVLAFSATSPTLGGDFENQESPKVPIQSPVKSAFTIYSGWESRYVTEGRDNLDGEGMFVNSLEFQYGGLLIGSWLAYSDGADYEERNFTVEHGWETGPLAWYVGYTFLQFPKDGNEDDNEVGAGVAVPDLLLGVTPGVDWYHSFDSEASFMEFYLTREIHLTDKFHLAPVVTLGRNDGYISEGHNGINHFSAGLYGHYHITDRVALQAHVSQNWAIDSDPVIFADDVLLRDFFHAGMGVSVTF